MARIADQVLSLGPRGLRHFDIAVFVLSFPGKSFTHGVEFADVPEFGEDQVALSGGHAALDELHHGAFHVVRDTAENHSKGGRTFALTLAGVHDHQALFVGLGGHDLIAGGLFLGHFGIVALCVCCVGHRGLPFHLCPECLRERQMKRGCGC